MEPRGGRLSNATVEAVVTIPDARIEAARRYGEAHGVSEEWIDRLVAGNVPGTIDHGAVAAAICDGHVVPVEEGAEDA